MALHTANQTTTRKRPYKAISSGMQSKFKTCNSNAIMVNNNHFDCKSALQQTIGGKFRTIVAELPPTMAPTKLSPEEFLLDLMKQKNSECQLVETLATNGFFLDPTNEEINAYASDVLTAIRSADIEQLRSFHSTGRPLKCSNRFGESLLHLACRKGLLDVVKFLLQEANVPVRVRDDYGRTPLHDACWTTKPNFALIELLIADCPDLLFMKDRRGHTPLAYARKHQWKEWNDFLGGKGDMISQQPVFHVQRQIVMETA